MIVGWIIFLVATIVSIGFFQGYAPNMVSDAMMVYLAMLIAPLLMYLFGWVLLTGIGILRVI